MTIWVVEGRSENNVLWTPEDMERIFLSEDVAVYHKRRLQLTFLKRKFRVARYERIEPSE